MTKKAKRTTKKQVIKLIDELQDTLLLQSWGFVLVFSKAHEDDGAVATCRADHVYKRAVITIYKDAFVAPNDIKHIIIHELCHCITEPLYVYCVDLLNGKLRTHTDILDQREVMTEHIAKIISRNI